MTGSVGSTSNVSPPPPPPPPPVTAKAVTVNFGSGQQPATYCQTCPGTPIDVAVRSGDTKIGYELQARANGLDPATIQPGSAEDKQVIADLSTTLNRMMAQGTARSDGIASNFSAFRAEAAATVAMRESGPTYSAAGVAQIPVAAGGRILRDNPILEVQWQTTTSPVTGKSGFSGPLESALDANGIRRDLATNPVPPGSTSSNAPAARTQNGNAARDAIADNFRRNPNFSDVQTEVPRTTSLGGREVDVVARERGARPEMDRVIEVESKLGRASASAETLTQVAKDGERIADNVSVRRLGSTLETVGRVARPVGVVIDAIQVGQAFRADGNRVGEQTVRASANVAGGAAGAWGGAKVGAAIGSLGGPVGTVIGGVVGGVVGGIVGSGLADTAVDWVKSWF